MKTVLLTGSRMVLTALAMAAAAPSARAESHMPPHGEAIMLVLTTQAAVIANAESEKGLWWHDTKVRGFRVQRPFFPGIIDSTHMFTVIYTVDEKAVLCWSVETRRKTVEAIGCP